MTIHLFIRTRGIKGGGGRVGFIKETAVCVCVPAGSSGGGGISRGDESHSSRGVGER